jgi:hypothetical protein
MWSKWDSNLARRRREESAERKFLRFLFLMCGYSQNIQTFRKRRLSLQFLLELLEEAAGAKDYAYFRALLMDAKELGETELSSTLFKKETDFRGVFVYLSLDAGTGTEEQWNIVLERAEEENSFAQYLLGKRGGDQNMMKKSAEQKNPLALYSLGTPSYDTVVPSYLREAFKLGYAEAGIVLGKSSRVPSLSLELIDLAAPYAWKPGSHSSYNPFWQTTRSLGNRFRAVACETQASNEFVVSENEPGCWCCGCKKRKLRRECFTRSQRKKGGTERTCKECQVPKLSSHQIFFLFFFSSLSG